MDWQEIIIQIGQSGAIVAGAVFILKKFIELTFSKDLEKSTIEFRIKYEKLHTERAEVIKNLYQKISITQSAFEAAISPIQNDISETSKSQRETIALKNTSEMFKYYNENRIFFEESLAQEIDEFIALFVECWQSFQLSQSMHDDNTKEYSMEWGIAWDKLTNTEIPAIKKNIESKFRSIIGINDENSK